MFVHTVIFKLKDDLSKEARAAFMEGVKRLEQTGSSESVHIGTPADTHRPVVNRDYDVCATVVLKDLAAHDAYQIAPAHLSFIEEFKDSWADVVIYDAD